MPRIYISPSSLHNTGIGSYGTEEAAMNKIADALMPLLTQMAALHLSEILRAWKSMKCLKNLIISLYQQDAPLSSDADWGVKYNPALLESVAISLI